MASDYEKQRLENIKKNNELLSSLGLTGGIVPEKAAPKKKPKRNLSSDEEDSAPHEPTRRSARIAGIQATEPVVLVEPRGMARSPRPPRKISRMSQHREDRPMFRASEEEILDDDQVLGPAPRPTRDEDGTLHFEDYAEFTPNLTPEEVFRNGSFGGTYFQAWHSRITKTDLKPDYDEFPSEWFEGIDADTYLTSEDYDPEVNFYGVKAGQGLKEWEDAGWVRAEDPRGWMQWYCRFYLGRRIEDDERQIRRWSGVCGPSGRFKRSLVKKIQAGGGEESIDDKDISPVVRQTLQHWAYRITITDYRDNVD
eukprot:TRINITY_DN4318_c0_g1_i1.p1 TRINITY_DN4318_c0_g1~~TRINITY_DN4318_c0_g1_i1.p1  ORF type:complete len:321 (-),score=45.33 TRINITY_DN4318_c0_g1_i1:8-937(-)